MEGEGVWKWYKAGLAPSLRCTWTPHIPPDSTLKEHLSSTPHHYGNNNFQRHRHRREFPVAYLAHFASASSRLTHQASGNLGRPTVDALLHKKQFKVSALTRATSSATFPVSVTPIKTDYTHASLVAAFKGQDAVVSTISTSSLTEQKRVIDAAVEAAVKRFIPSDFGWDTSGDVSLEIAPCMVMKKDPVAYLREKEETGMSWTSIVNGLWVDWVGGVCSGGSGS